MCTGDARKEVVQCKAQKVRFCIRKLFDMRISDTISLETVQPTLRHVRNSCMESWQNTTAGGLFVLRLNIRDHFLQFMQSEVM